MEKKYTSWIKKYSLRKDFAAMKKNKVFIILIAAAVLIAAYKYYSDHYSKAGILRKAVSREGYKVTELQKPINLTGVIKPEWIPGKENDVVELNEEIGKIGKVSIIIESVMNRGSDIYFNFDAIPYIRYKEGEFLYHYLINQDGTYTSYYSDTFKLYADNRNIDVGQTGTGPDSKFSFGINIEYYDRIKDGFTFDYTGGILYAYDKTQEGKGIFR